MQHNSTDDGISRAEDEQMLVSPMLTDWRVDLGQNNQQAALWYTDKRRNNKSCNCIYEATRRQLNLPAGHVSTLMLVGLLFLVVLLVGAQANTSSTMATGGQESAANSKESHGGDQADSLQAELNSIIQKHDALEESNKQLAEAIISRLMVDNLNNNEGPIYLTRNPDGSLTEEPNLDEQENAEALGGVSLASNDPSRTKRLLKLLNQYEDQLANARGNQPYAAFPELPYSQAVTMKRAAMKMGSYLQQQQRARQNYDFGLGKRPDMSSSVLRFGDSVQPVSQFGKRPSGHRFDFGLGKRVASPAYPRYDFGLGKRAPNRIRYDFGLG